jgi:YHS domain-containing protein
MKNDMKRMMMRRCGRTDAAITREDVMKKTMVIAVICSLTAFTAGDILLSVGHRTRTKNAALRQRRPLPRKTLRPRVVIDPVCGWTKKFPESKYSSKYNDKTYHSAFIVQKSLDKDPSKYIGTKTK